MIPLTGVKDGTPSPTNMGMWPAPSRRPTGPKEAAP